MFERQREEVNFIEKKRQWKGGVEKPLSRRTLLAMIPSLVIGVFLLLSAPYLKIIMENFLDDGQMLDLKVIDMSAPKAPKEKALPPPSPESQAYLIYRAQYDQEGFDWRKKPEAPPQDMELAKEVPIAIEPLDIELPGTAAEMERMLAERG